MRSAAKAVGLLGQLESEDQRVCDGTIASLRRLEIQCALPPESAAVEISASDAAVAVAQARGLLEKLQISVPENSVVTLSSS